MPVNRQLQYKPPGLIENYIYFYHLKKFCILPLYPESITDQMRSTFQETNALSRSAPVFTFNNSGPRTVSISLELHRDMMNDINTNVSNLKEIGPGDSDAPVLEFRNNFKEYTTRVTDNIEYTSYKLEEENDYVDLLIKYLMAAALPKYHIYRQGAKGVEPPMVAVRFGSDIFIKGVINSDVQVTYKKPIMVTSTGQSKYAKIDVTFTVYETDPYDADSVKELGSFRGICGTNNIFAGTEQNPSEDFHIRMRAEGGGGASGSLIPKDAWLIREPSLLNESDDSGTDNQFLNQKKDPWTDVINSALNAKDIVNWGRNPSVNDIPLLVPIGGESRGSGSGRNGE